MLAVRGVSSLNKRWGRESRVFYLDTRDSRSWSENISSQNQNHPAQAAAFLMLALP